MTPPSSENLDIADQELQAEETAVTYVQSDRVTEQDVEDSDTITEIEEEIIPLRTKRIWQLPRWLATLIVMVVLIGWNTVLSFIGVHWFWSEQLLYWLSLIGFFLINSAFIFLAVNRMQFSPRTSVMINLLATCIAAVALSVTKFMDHSVFWTFFNLITQPINAIALSLIASWLSLRLITKN